MATWVAMAARAAMAMVSTAHVDRMMEMEAMAHKMYTALEDRETPSVRPGRRRMVVDGWSSIAHGGRPDCTAFSLRDCAATAAAAAQTARRSAAPRLSRHGRRRRRRMAPKARCMMIAMVSTERMERRRETVATGQL